MGADDTIDHLASFFPAGRLRVMADPVARRRYSLIVGLEFGLLGAGAAVLGSEGVRWAQIAAYA